MTNPEDSVKRFPLEWPVGWVRTPRAGHLQHEEHREPPADRAARHRPPRGRTGPPRRPAAGPVDERVAERKSRSRRPDRRDSRRSAAARRGAAGKATVLACDRYHAVAGQHRGDRGAHRRLAPHRTLRRRDDRASARRLQVAPGKTPRPTGARCSGSPRRARRRSTRSTRPTRRPRSYTIPTSAARRSTWRT